LQDIYYHIINKFRLGDAICGSSNIFPKRYVFGTKELQTLYLADKMNFFIH